MKKIALIFFMFGLTSSCKQANTLSNNEKKLIKQEAKQMLDNYYNDIRQKGLLAELDYLDNSADFFWVPPGYSNAITYDSVVSVLKQNAPQFKSIDNSFKSLQIFPLNNQLTSYTGKLIATMTDTSGKVTNIHLIETGVIVKRTNGWKLLNGQTAILNP